MKNKIWIFYLLTTTLVIMLACSCKKDEDLIKLGQNFQGGTVFYLLQKGDYGYDKKVQHGFIAAAEDQNVYTYWDLMPSYNNPIGTRLELGTGSINTWHIFGVLGSYARAASICSILELNGYSDWYLPSKDELYKLYLNRRIVGGFADCYYWSSSEYEMNYVWIQSFIDGEQRASGKDQGFAVRAIRSF
jgi:hypothetical protein